MITLFIKEAPDDVPEGSDWLARYQFKIIGRFNVMSGRAFIWQGQRRGIGTNSKDWDNFCTDKDSSTSQMVFNRSVSLRDTWAKMEESASKSNFYYVMRIRDTNTCP